MAKPEVNSSDQTWDGLLEHLSEVRNAEHSTDADRRDAQIEAFDYVLQTILEKLRGSSF